MSITKDTIKETIKTIMAEEGDYKAFFKKALEKAGKDIPSMSDEEKKEFFNKIDAAWDGKGEKNEGNAFGAAVVAAKEAGEDEFEVDGEKFKVEESVNEGTDIYLNKRIQITKFSGGKDGKLVQINAPKVQNSGDHIIMKIDDFKKMLKNSSKLLKQVQESVNEVNESHSDCGCGCGGVTEGGCSTNLPIELSEELTFEINTFLERPVLSKNNNKITVENSELSNLIPTLVKNEIHKRLSFGVKKEFIELLKNYK
ncbi:hypothetical protein N9I13_00010 [bacterium]|nr:hypothetical protein [bacterium]